MKKGIMVTACFSLFAGCRKNNDKQPSPGQFDTLRIKTVTGADSFEGRQEFYSYDGQKRIIQEIEVLWESDTAKVVEYKYFGDNVSIKVTQNNSIEYKNFKLNSGGYIMADTVSASHIYSYEYNDKGFITKTYSNAPAPYISSYYYNVSNGLLDSSRATIGGVWHSSQYYLYDLNRLNTLEDKNFGKSFYGNRMLRPLIHYEYKYIEGNIVKTQTIYYIFTYDEKGRIKSKSYESAGQKLTNHYTYY